jgi:CBS domain-containing protein
MANNHRPMEGKEGAAPQPGNQQGNMQPLHGMTEADQAVQQLAEVAEVYRGVAQRIADEARALAGAPMAAVGGLQEVLRAWAEWLRGAVQTNARFSQEVMRARSLPEIAQVHARLVEESLSGLREGGTRVLEAAGGVAERALGPGPQQGDGGAEDKADEGPVTVAGVMTRNVRVAGPEYTVQEAAQVMAEADAGVLPVGEDDRIIGMLTDRDIAVRVVGATKDPTKTKVREAMTPGVEFCSEPDGTRRPEHVRGRPPRTDLQAVVKRLGRANSLAGKLRESLLSVGRMSMNATASAQAIS